MYQSIYQVTAMNRYNTGRIVREIEAAKVTGDILGNRIPNHSYIYLVIGKNAKLRNIPQFNHPIMLDDGSIVLDLRTFNQYYDEQHDNFIVPTSGHGALLIRLAKLIKLWSNERYRTDLFSTLGFIPQKTFVYWLNRTINAKFQPEVGVQEKVKLLLAWFYRCQFIETKDVKLTEDLLYKQSTRFNKLTLLSIEESVEIIKSVGFINTVGELTDVLQKLGDKRLELINVPALFASTISGWYGTTAAREMVAISLEYPPMWLAIIYSALTERMYKKSAIAETALSTVSRNMSESEFTISLNNLLREAEDE